MDQDIRVSIITVCYNAEATIEKTIKSVLSQTYFNIEYIIIDGKSTDNTMNIVNKYKRKIAKIICEPDNGIYDAMNKGIKIATGNIIGILNADDWYEQDAVENVVKAFTYSDAELIYTKAKMIYSDQSSFFTKEALLEKLWYDVVIMHPTVFVKRDVYNEYGLFNTSYNIAADYELLLRYYKKNVKIYYIEKYVVNFSLGGKSTIDFINGVKEVRDISLRYASEYKGEENIYALIENRYKEALFNMSLQGPSAILKGIFEQCFTDCNEGIYIFGTGYYGQTFLRVLNLLGISVRGFLDNDENKQTNLKDIAVYNPEILRKGKFNVFIATNNYSQEIVEQIKNFSNEGIIYLTLSELRNYILKSCDVENN